MHKEATFAFENKQLFYHIFGESPETIVLLHGIPTNSYLWQGVIPYLSQKYSLIVPDLLGYGRSGRTNNVEELSLPQQAAHIIKLLDHLGVRQAHFVGHDLGGGLVQIIAVNNPERVRSLVIADGVCFSNWPLPHVVAMRWPTAPEFEASPKLVESMLRRGIFHQDILTPQIILAFTIPFSDPQGPEALFLAASALEHVQTESLVDSLPNIKVPATFLWGQYDRFLPPYWGKKLEQTIPDSELKILPNCGHYSMLDNPSLFAEELMTHLTKIRQPAYV